MTKLLIDEPPLQIIPSLAVEIGLNEAIFIQQLHYWLARSKTEALGCKWVYNTAAEWKAQFPFWSENTIRRTIESLRSKKLISTVKLNANKHDQTLFFTISYANLPDRSTQNEQIEQPNMSSSDLPKMGNSSLSETTTKTTTESQPNGWDEFWRAYPRKEKKHDALKAFSKLKPNEELISLILAKIKQNSRSEQWLRDGGKYVPMAATWINGKRWEDSINAPQASCLTGYANYN